MVEQVNRSMLQIPGYELGDTVVIVAGAPPNTPGSTNLIRLHQLGQATSSAMT
jgi:pyruvate kinase